MTEAEKFRTALATEVSEAAAEAGLAALRSALEAGLVPLFALNAATVAVFGRGFTEAALRGRGIMLVDVTNALMHAGAWDPLAGMTRRKAKR